MSPERSAGGVVIREQAGHLELAVIRPRGRSTVWALPKGHVDPGERLHETAAREVREETGLSARLEAPLGEIRYSYQHRGRLVHKEVAFFLFRHHLGEIDQLEPSMRVEVDEARWILLERAQELLSYPGEREVVARAASLLRQAASGAQTGNG